MYTAKKLQLKTLKRLKAIASELSIYPAGDKRLKWVWIEAILLHQPQQQPQPTHKPSCATCPFASHISSDRYLCTADPDKVASAGQVVRGHWEVSVDCQEAITCVEDAEVKYIQQLEAKHEADFRSTEKMPTEAQAEDYIAIPEYSRLKVLSRVDSGDYINVFAQEENSQPYQFDFLKPEAELREQERNRIEAGEAEMSRIIYNAALEELEHALGFSLRPSDDWLTEPIGSNPDAIFGSFLDG